MFLDSLYCKIDMRKSILSCRTVKPPEGFPASPLEKPKGAAR